MNNNNQATSFNFIGQSSEINGELVLRGDTHIFGKFSGNITGERNISLIIEYTGQVEGTITGVNVIIKGQLIGDISSAEKIEISSTGKVKGIIEAKNFQIYPGSKIIGNIKTIKK